MTFNDKVPQKALAEIAAAEAAPPVQDEGATRRANGYAFFVPEHWQYAGLVCAFCRCPVDDRMSGDHDPQCDYRVWNDKHGSPTSEGVKA